MSAPGATPAQVPLRLAIAPATQVGWMPVTTRPEVLYLRTTCPARSPLVDAFSYSITATRTPLPLSACPPAQFAPTVAPADDIDLRHFRSMPRLTTSFRRASDRTAPGGRSTKTMGADVLTYATDPPRRATSARNDRVATRIAARRASHSSPRRARACSI